MGLPIVAKTHRVRLWTGYYHPACEFDLGHFRLECRSALPPVALFFERFQQFLHLHLQKWPFGRLPILPRHLLLPGWGPVLWVEESVMACLTSPSNVLPVRLGHRLAECLSTSLCLNEVAAGFQRENLETLLARLRWHCKISRSKI